MRKIYVTDTTLNDSASARESALSFKEKIEIARQLDKLCIDTIELGEIKNKRTDTLLISTVSAFIKNNRISVPVGMTKESVDIAFEALSSAKSPCLRVELPVSTVQMEYFCHKKPAKMLELIKELVSYCKSLCQNTVFCAVDATRAEPEFLISAIKAALESGAEEITLCDNACVMMPDEFGDFIKSIYDNVEQLKSVRLGVCCDNSKNLGLASAIMAVKAGASDVKVSTDNVNCASIGAIADLLRDCGDRMGIYSSLNLTDIGRRTKQIDWIINTKRSSHSPFDNGVNEESDNGIKLSINDDISTVLKAVAKLGYDLSEDDNAKVYESFKNVAQKKQVSNKELEAIVASTALQVPPTYKLVSYVINSGNIISASAHIVFEKSGEQVGGISLGDGPIDAAFLAIEQIVGRHFELDDFQIQAVTEGREAMGSALVKLRSNSKLYSGNGISTDIIGASIQAYVNALNKIIYEEEAK